MRSHSAASTADLNLQIRSYVRGKTFRESIIVAPHSTLLKILRNIRGILSPFIKKKQQLTMNLHCILMQFDEYIYSSIICYTRIKQKKKTIFTINK